MELITTAKYSVFDIPLSHFEVRTSNLDEDCLQLHLQGFLIWGEHFNNSSLIKLNDGFDELMNELKSHYDMTDDSFESFDREFWNVSRLPRIGDGKHNVHFDIFESHHHGLLTEFIHDCGLLHLLQAYLGCKVQLRETGLSVTRPMVGKSSGEGMEWHSDGSAGEYTVLMSLTDISADTGSLCLAPRSHLEYKPGLGHVNIDSESNDQRSVIHNYKAGVPILLDARTLHKVTPNSSMTWRFVIWFIFDSY